MKTMFVEFAGSWNCKTHARNTSQTLQMLVKHGVQTMLQRFILLMPFSVSAKLQLQNTKPRKTL